MPIAQERLITLVAHADTLLSAFDNLKQFTKSLNIPEAITIGNSAIDHVDDINAKRSIAQLLHVINNMTDYFSNVYIPQELRDNIAEERIHFKKHKRRNEYLAQYKRIKANAERETAISISQIPQFFTYEPTVPLEPLPEPQPITFVSEPLRRMKTIAEYTAERKARGLVEPGDELEEKIETNVETNPPPNDVPAQSEKRNPQNVNSELTVKPQEHKDGVIRHIPDYTDLNAPPIPTGKSLL